MERCPPHAPLWPSALALSHISGTPHPSQNKHPMPFTNRNSNRFRGILTSGMSPIPNLLLYATPRNIPSRNETDAVTPCRPPHAPVPIGSAFLAGVDSKQLIGFGRQKKALALACTILHYFAPTCTTRSNS